MVLIINAATVECGIFLYTHDELDFLFIFIFIFVIALWQFSCELATIFHRQSAVSGRSFLLKDLSARLSGNYPRRVQGFHTQQALGRNLGRKQDEQRIQLLLLSPSSSCYVTSFSRDVRRFIVCKLWCIVYVLCEGVRLHKCGCCLHLCRCKYANRFFRHADDFFTATEMCLKFAKL